MKNNIGLNKIRLVINYSQLESNTKMLSEANKFVAFRLRVEEKK